MLARDYAEALYALASKDGSDHGALVKDLKQTLMRRGHLRLLPRIAREFAQVEKREQAASRMIVRVADKKQAKDALTAIESLVMDTRLAHTEAEVIEDPSLISGFAFEGSGFRYDNSARAALIAMYTSMIA